MPSGAGSDSDQMEPQWGGKARADQQLRRRGRLDSGDSDTSDASTDSEPAKAPTKLMAEQPRDQSFWRKWNVRVFVALALVLASLALAYWGRHTGVLVLIMVVQGHVYRELVLISIRRGEDKRLPTFKLFYYYWFAVVTFFVYARVMRPHFEPLRDWPAPVRYVLANHVFVFFWLYVAGFVAFVLSLRRRRYYQYQFAQFAYCHVALLVVVMQAGLLASNLFHGLVWFVMPCGMVACNDCFAYICGVWCGRTPLIRLSPKKTVEGFAGAFVATVVWAFWFCKLLESLDAFGVRELVLCPHRGIGWHVQPCDTDAIRGGVHRPYSVAEWAAGLGLPADGSLPPWLSEHTVSPFQLHCVVMAVFASSVAPFGGFFASGFKRAIGEKDFGSAFPGHGGWTDRMDCQIVMGSFSYMYLHYVVLQPGSGADVTAQALNLDAAGRTALLETLAQSLGMVCGAA